MCSPCSPACISTTHCIPGTRPGGARLFIRINRGRETISMDPAAAKLIGAGLAAIGTGAAAIGVGNLFGQFLQGALRNPSAADGQFGRLIFGFAVTEALGIFALLIAFLLLFT